MRILSIFAVIVLHQASAFSLYENTSLEWWVVDFYNSFARWCVPVFIMLSGYLLLHKEEGFYVFYRKRLSRILIPLIFWSFFYLLWNFTIHYFKWGGDIGFYQMIKALLTGRPYYHMWFLYMIPFIYITTPYLRILTKNLNKKEYLFLVVIFFLFSASDYIYKMIYLQMSFAKTSSIFHVFIYYIGYFLLGGYINKFNVKMPLLHSVLGFVFFAVITMILHCYNGQYSYANLSLNVILCSIFVFFMVMYTDKIVLSTYNVFFANVSFGVILPFLTEAISRIRSCVEYAALA
ncbi:acyltransferase [Shimwellia blattae]|nr:acyltransferase family protein [Shimwellia blattae]